MNFSSTRAKTSEGLEECALARRPEHVVTKFSDAESCASSYGVRTGRKTELEKQIRWRLKTFWLAASTLTSLAVFAAGIPTLDVVTVEADSEQLIGTADSASVGTVSREQATARPVFRPGEVLEEVPGLLITQHSSEGKANQYFLRGFNLDHGTDIRIAFDGTPVNQRSHGHGQGWADINWLIPELIGSVQYKKGPYFASEGDFASAGAVEIDYVDALPQGIASGTLGEFGYQRLLVANSSKVGRGDLLGGVEWSGYDGPWDRPDDFNKINGILRYSQGTPQNGFGITALAYDADGRATNQISQDAVDRGIISRFGSLDDTDGINVKRYSVNAEWRHAAGNTVTQANAYATKHELDLFSDFTYFLDDPVNGDQFLQQDNRVITGANGSFTQFDNWAGYDVENTVGVQVQNDDISNGLFKTNDRRILSTTRTDDIQETSLGAYLENRTQWLEKFRTILGVRADIFRFDVESNDPRNSGVKTEHIVNPKLALVFGPWAKTEYFVNVGGGYHSNDARGVTITTDPTAEIGTNIPGIQVPGLVRSKGYEVGARTAIIPGLQSSLAVYILEFDSELVFVGDAGNTEAGRPSRRIGFEFANFYKPTEWLTIDADIAYANARYRDSDLEGIGKHIAGAVEGVATLGASVDNLGPWFGGFQFRFFGPRPLIEDDSVRSESTILLAARAGYKVTKALRIQIEGFNLLDRDDNQIDYFYESRLANDPPDPVTGELVGTEGIHFHPVEPINFRVSLQYDF